MIDAYATKRYEHLVATIPAAHLHPKLEAWGEHGWELVSVFPASPGQVMVALKMPVEVAQPEARERGRVLSTEDVAGILGVSRAVVRELAAQRQIAAWHVGNRLKFRQADIEDYMERRVKEEAG